MLSILPVFLKQRDLLSWHVTAVSSGLSFLLSSTLAVLLFAGMQLYKAHLASHEWTTIVGGFLGSLLFCLVLTVSLDVRVWQFVCVLLMLSVYFEDVEYLLKKHVKNVHAAGLKAVSIVMVQKVNWRIEHAYAKIWAGNQENIQRRQIKIDLNRKRLL